MSRNKVEVLEEPIKSENDNKFYRAIKLENGLNALLISDPSDPSESEASYQNGSNSTVQFDANKMAACAISVGVGSLSDPPEIQGLSHFVEHMLFMGSEKYPEENEYFSFIRSNGGGANAWTSAEETTYFFKIQGNYLPTAMDMLSQFFVSPLMKKESMQREREAIQSEFAIALPKDEIRRNQMLASTFPKGHPGSNFKWGNMRSLRDDIGDDKLYQTTHDYVKRHYSAHRMKVAIQAGMDLDSLEKYVVNTFGNIPNNKLPREDTSKFKFTSELITPEFNRIYYVKPIGDATEIQLTWLMRSLKSEYQLKVADYVASLLGNEGKGSLLSYLRKKVWALEIAAGTTLSSGDNTSMYTMFKAQIVLTKEGLHHIDEVVEAVFSYIKLLKTKGPSESIFNDLKALHDTNFRFVKESQPAENVKQLVLNMHRYPPQHYITGENLYYKYDPKAIVELLEALRPNNMNVMIISNEYSQPIEYDSQEKWFGTLYKREEVPSQWLQRWLQVEPLPSFSLPEKNIFITTDFAIIPPPEPYIQIAHKLGVDLVNSSPEEIYRKVESSPKETVVLKQDDLMATVNDFKLDRPNRIRRDKNMEVWYKPSFNSKLPIAIIYFYFLTPFSLQSPRYECLIDLWTDVVLQGLKEPLYPAMMAGLESTFEIADKGIALKVRGYSQNLNLVVDLITREIRGAVGNLSQPMFEALRDERARSYHNTIIKPVELNTDIRLNILVEPYISIRDKAPLLQDVTLEELQSFSKQLLDRMYLQVLVQGNVPWYEAIRVSERVHSNIGFKDVALKELPEMRVHQLALGVKTVRVMSLNPQSANTYITNCYQADPINPKELAILEVLMILMKDPVFSTLRTNEQLGYTAGIGFRNTHGVLSYSVVVNSQVDNFSVAYVDSRIEAFLRKYFRDVRQLGAKAVQRAREALIQKKLSPDVHLNAEVDRNWGEIESMKYNFQRLFSEADAVKTITLSDIITWVDNHFPSGNNSMFRKLSIQVNGYKNTDHTSAPKVQDYKLKYLNASQPVDEMDESNIDFVMDINTYKKSLPFINVPKVQRAQG